MNAVPAEEGTMAESLPPCQYTDVALTMQQMIRERATEESGAPETDEIGEACGAPSVGSVEIEGVRRYFCAAHVIEEPIVRT
jgi:hypothetical protein